MSPPIIAFFSNTGGSEKTSLVYHLAWMYSKLGLNVLAADLDPQAKLTAAFLDEDTLEKLWGDVDGAATLYGCIRPLLEGTGDVRQPHVELVGQGARRDKAQLGTWDIGQPHVEPVYDNLGLIAGDIALSSFEDELSQQWPQCMDGEPRAFRVITAFWRALRNGSLACNADVILVDVGPNLGAINRAALVAADYVVVPLSPDLFSLQGLKTLGPTLRRWREEWQDRTHKNPDPSRLGLPSGGMQTAGYIVQQHGVRLDRPVKAYARWMQRIPEVYRRAVLDDQVNEVPRPEDDPHCLGSMKHYRSLMPMAQEAGKPMFLLQPADGAIGAHQSAVRAALTDFDALARRIAARTQVSLP